MENSKKGKVKFNKEAIRNSENLPEQIMQAAIGSEARRALGEATGLLLEKMGMAGLPALMGIDISGSLQDRDTGPWPWNAGGHGLWSLRGAWERRP